MVLYLLVNSPLKEIVEEMFFPNAQCGALQRSVGLFDCLYGTLNAAVIACSLAWHDDRMMYVNKTSLHEFAQYSAIIRDIIITVYC